MNTGRYLPPAQPYKSDEKFPSVADHRLVEYFQARPPKFQNPSERFVNRGLSETLGEGKSLIHPRLLFLFEKPDEFWPRVTTYQTTYAVKPLVWNIEKTKSASFFELPSSERSNSFKAIAERKLQPLSAVTKASSGIIEDDKVSS